MKAVNENFEENGVSIYNNSREKYGQMSHSIAISAVLPFYATEISFDPCFHRFVVFGIINA